MSFHSNFIIISGLFDIVTVSHREMETFMSVLWPNLTKVGPLFTPSHRGSDNSPLLIMFSANSIDQSIVTFIRLSSS